MLNHRLSKLKADKFNLYYNTFKILHEEVKERIIYQTHIQRKEDI
jgi:hypothetical protein